MRISNEVVKHKKLVVKFIFKQVLLKKENIFLFFFDEEFVIFMTKNL